MLFTALIPTAGRSRRMGTPKAWLKLNGEPFLSRIVRTACDAGAFAVVVVAGAEEDTDPSLVSRIEIATRVETPRDVRLSVALGDPTSALIESIRAGLDLVAERSAVLLWPVDAPFADARLVRRLADALDSDRGKIAVPVVGDTHCHPVLIGPRVAKELTSEAADNGAHAVVQRDPSRLIPVRATDIRLTRTLNTPADARALGISLP